MAGMSYDYDENASSWPYFVLTILIVILLPVLYSYFSGISNQVSSGVLDWTANGQIKLSTDPATPIDPQLKSYKLREKKSKFVNKKLAIIIALVIGIASIFYLNQSLPPLEFGLAFDPFEILDISSSATDREIKSHYRKLSLVYHPDKISRDATEEEKEELELKFVLINKAYKALTDEDTKRNYELYGHPDGPQDVTHGIALPKWFVDGSYSWILTILYIIGIAVLLPWGVGKWWNRVQSYTKKGIHVDTARVFTNRLLNHNPANVVTVKEILGLISKSAEFQIMFGSKYEPEDIKIMLNDYLRRDFGAYETGDVLRLVSIVPNLISGLIDIAATFRNTEMVVKCIETNKCIIQAVSPSVSSKYYEFLQLPHVELSKIDKSFEVYSISKFFTLSKEDQKKFLGVNDAQLEDIITVGSNIPYIKLAKAEFKVPGEDVVPPSSHANLSMKVIVKSALDKRQPVLSRKALEEEETFESLRDPFKIVADQPGLPPTFASYFPRLNIESNGWICLLVNQKDNKISDLPQHFQRLSLSNLKAKSADELIVGSIKQQLSSTTPPQPGSYPFRCVLKSLDYFGNDLEFPVTLEVQEPAIVDTKDQYEIEDPDEDSVAGMMAQLKGESVKRNHEYDSSDEEDSDFEEESDFTDINTDTEDEKE